MADSQGTWKDRLEEYRRAQARWQAGKPEEPGIVRQICRETSVPALESGFSALFYLARDNRVGAAARDVVEAAMKQISATKPAMKVLVRKVLCAIAEHQAEMVAQQGLERVRDRNPRNVAEMLRFLQETRSVHSYLLPHILAHTGFLFGHGTGNVRDEAARLFRCLAALSDKAAAAIRDATQNLKPIQLREIFGEKKVPDPAPETPRESEQICAVKPGTAGASQGTVGVAAIPSDSPPSTSAPRTQEKEPDQTPRSISPAQHTRKEGGDKSATERKEKSRKDIPQKVLRNLPLPSGFFEKLGSAQWKERLVVKELEEKLGASPASIPSQSDTEAVVSAILKRITEPNNQVLISCMAVLERLVLAGGIHSSACRDVLGIIGKRLRDKKPAVYESVLRVVEAAHKKYPRMALEYIPELLSTEKSSRGRVLGVLDRILQGEQPRNLEREKLLSSLVECTRDPSAGARALAASCISTVLAVDGDMAQAEIESLGIERILAERIQHQIRSRRERAQEEGEKDSEIIESICKDIRNTTISHDPSVLMTPIKKSAETAQDITLSPFVEVKSETPQAPDTKQEGSMERRNGPVPQPGFQAPGSSPRIPRTEILQYIKEGVLERDETSLLIETLGKEQRPGTDARIVGVLQHLEIEEPDAQRIKEKLEGISPSRVLDRVSLEALKGKVDRIICKKKLFEHKCVLAGLLEKLARSEHVEEEEAVNSILSLARQGYVLEEEEARALLKGTAEQKMWRAAEKIETVFPVSRLLGICTETAEQTPSILQLVQSLVEKCRILPHAQIDSVLSRPEFVGFLERSRTGASKRILSYLKKEEAAPLAHSPYIKRVRQPQPGSEVLDVNAILNEIIDQDGARARDSLARLESAVQRSIGEMLGCASTLVNVLLLQLHDALSSGSLTGAAEVILRILKKVSGSDRFLAALDRSTLVSLTSDYISIISGGAHKAAGASEHVRKECGETLIKICANGPAVAVFKIYMGMLGARHREERTKEVLVKLIWKHSKVIAPGLGDKKTVAGILSALNTFHATFKGGAKDDPLVTKVLQLHLIEMLKHYGDTLPQIFSVSGPVLHHIRLLTDSQ